MDTKLDIPDYLIDWFSLRGDAVHWTTRNDAALAGLRGKALSKLKPAIAGKPVGARLVHGRGSIVHCSGRRLLSVDILDALQNGMVWPWERGAPLRHDPASLSPDGDKALKLWALNGDTLVWAVERHPSRPIGSPVQGALLSGPRGRFVSSGDLAWLMSDVVHALREGAWPWDEWN